MATSEIDKLERRYAENPQGLTFAPLAEVYRKNGELSRALDLLGPGLERHPEYVPAHIVLGRCRLDLGELPEAEQAFSAVLALDGENVIALKALADIDERLGRYAAAERWLETLLTVDRNNPGAQEQLARLAAAKMQTEGQTEREAGVPVAVEGNDDRAGGTTAEDVTAAAASETAALSIALPEAHAPEAEAVSGTESEVPPSKSEPTPEPALEVVSEVTTWTAEADIGPGADDPATLVIDELTVPDEPVSPVEGMQPQEDETSTDDVVEALPGLVMPDSPALRDELVEMDVVEEDAFRIETADDLVLRPSGASEFQMPDASQDLVAARPEPDPLAPTPVQVDEVPMPAVTDESAMAVVEEPAVEEPYAEANAAGVDAAPTADASAELAPVDGEPMDAAVVADDIPVETTVVETVLVEAGADQMALAEEPPPTVDSAPVNAVSETNPVPAAPPEAAEAAGELPGAEAEAAEPAPIVTETMAEVLLRQGYTADALLIYRELERRAGGDGRLADKIAALEGQTRPAASRPPTYVARDTGGQSVHEFFRALLAARIAAPAAPMASAPSTAASAPAAATPAGATRPATDGLSLSAVFGEEASPVPPAVPAGPGAEPSFDAFFGRSGGAGASTGRAARAPEAKDDDLDQFHAWLQNLKR